jgi:hypothetical protein
MGAHRTGLLVLAIVVATAGVALPHTHASDPSVRLVVTADEKLFAEHTAFQWDDEIALAALPAGATALDLLDHVTTARESTYTVSWHDGAAYVDEINGVSSDFPFIIVGYYWALYENDTYSDHAINEIVLYPGSLIQLTYQGWPLDL